MVRTNIVGDATVSISMTVHCWNKLQKRLFGSVCASTLKKIKWLKKQIIAIKEIR
nr:MAG TPA: hypothetical protein [Caudoviricetes sp.]